MILCAEAPDSWPRRPHSTRALRGLFEMLAGPLTLVLLSTLLTSSEAKRTSFIIFFVDGRIHLLS